MHRVPHTGKPRRALGLGLWVLAILLGGAAPLRLAAQPGTLQFKSLAFAGKEGGAPVSITVTRVNGSAGTVTVDFFTEDGTAMAGLDYVPTNGTLEFGPGVSSRTFTVAVLNDLRHEPAETVTLQLVNAGGGAIVGPGGQNATLTLADNDPCVFTLAPLSRSHGPEGGSGTVVVNATAGCLWTVDRSANWLGATPPGGEGSNVVTYFVDPNPGTAPRSATLRVGGRTFTVTQAGQPPPDVTKPVASVTVPASGARVTNLPLVVTGRATDAGGVALVEYRLENSLGTNAWLPADGTTNWSVTLPVLPPGANTVRVRATDAAGNLGLEVFRSFQHVVVSPLTLLVLGEGSVTPNLNGQLLEVGRTYTVTAAPRTANLFSNWTGGVATNHPTLSFRMQANLQLEANFVPNPFLPRRGAYNGLFLNAGPARHESAGFLTASTTDAGAYSAKLTLAGQVIPLSGRFALDGRATNLIARTGLNPVSVQWQLDLADPHGLIVGTVGDGNWSAQLRAHRALYSATTNPAPQAGRYTLLFPGDADPARAPAGTSVGSVTVDSSGRVSLSGTLADGTPVVQKTTLSQDGEWPLHVRLYQGAGEWLGWASFSEAVDRDLDGVLWWNRPAQAGGLLYPNGFAHAASLTGARHQPPTGPTDYLLNDTNLVAVFSAGNLQEPFANPLVLKPGNLVANLGTNRLTLSIVPSTGLFSGSVAVPGSSRTLLFKGALQAKGNYGAGFFTGTNEGGRVNLTPAP
ncbi:MAG: hypothetical protein RJA22_2177 [Verrucomicrobiota bacterium]